MKPLVIYHAECIDGFTAAWCLWRTLGDSADYVPAKHGSDPPDVTGRDVTIVDFSYPRAMLNGMAMQAKSIRVLDHHKTAQADLEGLSFCEFDMNRSGAGMAWDAATESPRLPLVDYVEDRDLWRFKLPSSKEINAFIGSLDQNFTEWSRASAMLCANFDACKFQGEALLRAVDRYVREMSKHAIRRDFQTFEDIQVVNAPYINTSELVGYLAEKDPERFAVGWFVRNDGRYQYSLRSRGDFDVSVLAKALGGGGHKNAAGFTAGILL